MQGEWDFALMGEIPTGGTLLSRKRRRILHYPPSFITARTRSRPGGKGSEERGDKNGEHKKISKEIRGDSQSFNALGTKGNQGVYTEIRGTEDAGPPIGDQACKRRAVIHNKE
jgi:hypothetical protein